MPVYLLPDEPVFPPANEAEEEGLLAIGGDFSTDRLLNAYASGIFPWFVHEGEPYWFSPDPRLVLFPDKLKVSKSLERIIRSDRFEVRMDTDFEAVIRQCARIKRAHEPDTWISDEFIEGYTNLYKKGFAHSVECYHKGELVGGLYGLSLGKAFFGESMFFTSPNASKVALYHLVKQLMAWDFTFIDCQVETEHFLRMGAMLMPRTEYLNMLEEAIKTPTRRGSWFTGPVFSGYPWE
ncbi:MAG: leucyl/phenylalanyl-tRNA--protein transferase [Bacteroidales bacterium]|nr:leucyl/phenylalanyl-tRNA--protein transferase [Bacteroidales bacterium]